MAPAAGGPGEPLLRRCGGGLRALREAAAAGGVAGGEAELLALLEPLRGAAVTPEALRESGVGREVNDRFLRLHESAAVRELSRELVHAWKAAVRASTAPEATKGPAVAPSAEPAPAPVLAPAPSSTRGNAGSDEGRRPVQGREEQAAKETKRPVEKDASTSSPKVKKPTVTTVAGAAADSGPNADLAALFKELSGFEFKRNEKHKGIAYKRVAATLSAHPERVACGKDAMVLPGVGKESGKKIDEFLSTGKIERLEKYRRGELDD